LLRAASAPGLPGVRDTGVITTAQSPARLVRPLLAATTISVTGDEAFVIAAALLAAELTRNPMGVASVNAAFCIAWLVFGIPGGALVARLPLRRVLVTADLIRTALLVVLAVVVALGYVSVWLIVVIMLASGIVQTTADPASQAILPAIVGDDPAALAEVNGRYWSLDRFGRILFGPPLGSLLLAVSRPLPFAADGVSFLASAGLMRRLPDVPALDIPAEPIRAAMARGLRYVLADADLRVIVVCNLAWNLAYASSFAVYVLWAREVLHVPAAVYGFLIVPGAVAGAVVAWKSAPAIMRRMPARRIITTGMLVQAAAWILVVTVRQTWAAIAGLAVTDVCGVVVAVAISTVYQRAPKDMRTRISSISRTASWGGAGVGSLAGGAIATAFGLPAAFITAAAIAAAAGVMAWLHR
jgi:MFS family permease